ncbi:MULTISPECIES: abortive infection family protein [Pseudomonas]|uniref:Abortive infection family protein n=1 Tax=Pseudomonas wuhanensis TaxID=2954098 RepID=A0ABY9GVK4_9PSED|nr:MULTISPECIES: abortive infection family protein [unclassified Pseudomonas]WLI13883.1 abortive infection family protein [Pseudomonas sp. FP603]WLI19781.1 abortive infection family protein [Pseudomonas sp. FP607]
MAVISAFERRKLEKLLGMGSGYVLDFSDRTYADFFIDYRIDIDAAQYRSGGDSKAKRMRAFWDIAPNHTVGKVLDGLITYGVQIDRLGDSSPQLTDDCRKIAMRLLSDQSVADLDALTAIADDRDFEVVAEHVREAIEKNQPEGGLDRLHTFVNKFIRVTCEPHGISISREKPLHSVFGEYVKALRERGHLESAMTDRILKSSISVLEAFNDVRNNKSLAHDNPILNYDESLLIFNHVASSIRFIKSLEAGIKANSLAQKNDLPPWDETIPF